MAYSSHIPNRDFLWEIFQRVDTDKSGCISPDELQRALSNGTWNPFNIQTVKLMVGMFDKNGHGVIKFEEFGALWKYVADWHNCFKSFDQDNSGSIDRSEFSNALRTFGYRLGESLIDIMMKKFDSSNKGNILFDDFIRCCVILNMLTSSFREYDTDQDGVIKIHYEQFLMMVLFSVPL